MPSPDHLTPAGRIIGVALDGCIMAMAIVAILAHGLYDHLPSPILLLFPLALVGLGHPA